MKEKLEKSIVEQKAQLADLLSARDQTRENLKRIIKDIAAVGGAIAALNYAKNIADQVEDSPKE